MEKISQQKFDTAIGSPVSPIVASLFLEFLEQHAIATARSHVLLDCGNGMWTIF